VSADQPEQQQPYCALQCHLWQDASQDAAACCRWWQEPGEYADSAIRPAGAAAARPSSNNTFCWLYNLQVGTTLRIGGWVKTGREAGAGAFAFLEINDGSCFDSLQVRHVWYNGRAPAPSLTSS
jgi:hypothetical protein